MPSLRNDPISLKHLVAMQTVLINSLDTPIYPPCPTHTRAPPGLAMISLHILLLVSALLLSSQHGATLVRKRKSGCKSTPRR